MNIYFAMLNGPEIVMILAIVLILFGAKKLPELARGLGQGIKEFKKSSRDVQDELEAAIHVPEPPVRPPQRKLPVETQVHAEAQPEQAPSQTKS